MKRKGLKKILIIFILLIALILISLSPLFRIRHIKVSEVHNYSKDDISEALSASLEQNGFTYIMKNIKGIKNIDYFFMLRAKSAEDDLTYNMPYLKNVKIRFNPPSELEVTFQERTPSFLINVAGVYICSASDGVIVNSFSEKEEVKLPLLKGLNIDEYKIGSTIKTTEGEKLKSAMDFFHTLEQCDKEFKGYNLTNIIDIVDFSEYNNIWLFIGDNLKVKLGGSENLITKLAQLKAICDKEKDKIEKDNLTGVIDFTLGLNPVLRN